jgi:hypothetical protein
MMHEDRLNATLKYSTSALCRAFISYQTAKKANKIFVKKSHLSKITNPTTRHIHDLSYDAIDAIDDACRLYKDTYNAAKTIIYCHDFSVDTVTSFLELSLKACVSARAARDFAANAYSAAQLFAKVNSINTVYIEATWAVCTATKKLYADARRARHYARAVAAAAVVTDPVSYESIMRKITRIIHPKLRRRFGISNPHNLAVATITTITTATAVTAAIAATAATAAGVDADIDSYSGAVIAPSRPPCLRNRRNRKATTSSSAARAVTADELNGYIATAVTNIVTNSGDLFEGSTVRSRFPPIVKS